MKKLITFISIVSGLNAFGQTATKNYIKTYRARKALNITLVGNSDPWQTSQAVQYFDGLGRPGLTIERWESSTREALITPFEYDPYGRQAKQHLPVPYGSTSTHFVNHNSVLSSARTYYAERFGASDANAAYVNTVFEDSPLNRPVAVSSPGSDWHSNPMEFQYLYNTWDEVRKWELGDQQVNSDGFYSAGTLQKTVTIDEDNNQTIEYVNNLGKTVLKMSETGDFSAPWAETSYIYDEFNRLRVVLPPQANDLGKSLNILTQDFLADWAFQYEYDDRGRMISKKIPGADKVLMVYDRWDRLVLTQDGVQRASNEWLFTKYDKLNRSVMTGIMHGGSEADVRNAAASRANVHGERFSLEGTNQYTNYTFPKENLTYLTITYYDTYDWNNTGLTFSDPSSQLTWNTNVKGQVTGMLTKTESGSWIKSANYYDEKYRLIQTRSKNHLGGIDAVTNYYDFIGQVTKTIHSHNGDKYSDDIIISRRFEYDHTGRLLKTYHKINDEEEVLLSSNTYNEVGELVEKDLHGEEQSVDYSYNIRGWLRGINDSGLSDGEGDLFGMELYYNTNPLDIKRRYLNGNIGAIRWSDNLATTGNRNRAYTYKYDKLNRLRNADHYENQSNTKKYDVDIPAYDLNGNILQLKRRSHAASSYMDDLRYSYMGNQLQKVDDEGDDSEGFSEVTTGDDYTYDANGNMISDSNKEIASISYNHLNLPTRVTFNNGDYIRYMYDASGVKLRQSVYKGGKMDKVTDYVGAFIYEIHGSGRNRDLQLILHDEGRIVPTPIVEERRTKATAGHEKRDLSPGDLRIIGVNAKNPDEIAILAMVDLEAGAVIHFTDKGWLSEEEGFRKYEGTMTYTVPETGITAGSIIVGSKDSPGFNATGGFKLAMKGDQVFIYQGSLSNPSLIYGFQFGKEGWTDSESPVSSRKSRLPSALEDGSSAQALISTRSNHKLNADWNNSRGIDPSFNGNESHWMSTNKRYELVANTEPDEVEYVKSKIYDYQYHLKDHLGNVRLTFSTTPENYTVTETFESDQNGFQNLHRFTNVSANTTAGGNEVERLESGQTGAMVLLSVNKGDKMNLSVNANYTTTPKGNSFQPVSFNSLFALFDKIYGSVNTEGISATDDQFQTALGSTILNQGKATTNNPAIKAYLNYIFFDENMNYVKAGFKQITTEALGIGVHETIRLNGIMADRHGYILAYLSNENREPVNVHFDDFTVYHEKTIVVQSDDYYPFGGTFNSYRRTASGVNNFKFGGKEEQTSWGAGVFDFEARFYDAAIGRFMTPDPLAETQLEWNPYHYVFNNPIRLVDPTGLNPEMFDKSGNWAVGSSSDGMMSGGFSPFQMGGGDKKKKKRKRSKKTPHTDEEVVSDVSNDFNALRYSSVDTEIEPKGRSLTDWLYAIDRRLESGPGFVFMSGKVVFPERALVEKAKRRVMLLLILIQDYQSLEVRVSGSAETTEPLFQPGLTG